MQSYGSFCEVAHEFLSSIEEFSKLKDIISDQVEKTRDAAEALCESLEELSLTLEELPD